MARAHAKAGEALGAIGTDECYDAVQVISRLLDWVILQAYVNDARPALAETCQVRKQ